MQKALITGITGQDGSYLAELLIEKGYEVHGLIRRSSSSHRERIAALLQHPAFFLHEGDLCDSASLKTVIKRARPNEIYNLAAMSHVKTSFESPEYTADVNGFGVLRLLEAMKEYAPEARLYQASTSELFGRAQQTPQNEETPFYPRSPYGIAKLYAYWAVVNYREAYDLFACNGILFNHESPRRGELFVSRKITKAVARIAQGDAHTLCLGNLNAQRDWGYAKDFVEGMWRMLQQDSAEDFVLATGKSHSVRHFVDLSFKAIGREIDWEGSGIEEKGRERASGKIFVEVCPSLFRPAEVDHLQGDATKAKEKLGWIPKTSLERLVELMVEAELG
jgi:GDPmannose 4,6-dehydratase